MDGCDSPKVDMSQVAETKPDTQASKRRKVVEKTVVKVKISADAGNLKNEGPPSDSWSWRKYGQKPIKGSPFPRGYYRCSTSKGCSAKKQIERCRTDASILIITYTSSHNHPGPTLLNTKLHMPPKETCTSQVQVSEDFQPATPKQEHPQQEEEEEVVVAAEEAKGDQNQPHSHMPAADHEPASEVEMTSSNFHYLQSPLRISQEMMINQEEDPFQASGKRQETMAMGVLLEEEPAISCSAELMALSSTSNKSEENDFFDELEELPISSAFTSFMRTNLFDEIRIPIVPS